MRKAFVNLNFERIVIRVRIVPEIVAHHHTVVATHDRQPCRRIKKARIRETVVIRSSLVLWSGWCKAGSRAGGGNDRSSRSERNGIEVVGWTVTRKSVRAFVPNVADLQRDRVCQLALNSRVPRIDGGQPLLGWPHPWLYISCWAAQREHTIGRNSRKRKRGRPLIKRKRLEISVGDAISWGAG